MESLTLKRHNSFENENNIKATHTVLIPIVCLLSLQQEILKFSDIFVI